MKWMLCIFKKKNCIISVFYIYIWALGILFLFCVITDHQEAIRPCQGDRLVAYICEQWGGPNPHQCPDSSGGSCTWHHGCWSHPQVQRCWCGSSSASLRWLWMLSGGHRTDKTKTKIWWVARPGCKAWHIPLHAATGIWVYKGCTSSLLHLYVQTVKLHFWVEQWRCCLAASNYEGTVETRRCSWDHWKTSGPADNQR